MTNFITSEEIIKIIADIHSNGNKTNMKEYMTKYPIFFKKFPKLFFAAFEKEFDMQLLQLMLDKRDTITSNKESYDNANEQVQETLNEKYVYPVIPKEQLQQAMSQASLKS